MIIACGAFGRASSLGSVPFPSEITGLFADYDFGDADARTIVDGKFSAIQDKSGNGRHGSQSDAAQRPPLLSNVIAGGDAAGLGGYQLNVAEVSLDAGFSVFYVLKREANKRSFPIGSSPAVTVVANGEPPLRFENTNYAFIRLGGNGATSVNTDTSSAWNIWAGLSNFSLYKNGLSIAMTAPAWVNRHASMDNIGANYAFSTPARADTARILIYSRALDAAERVQVENYLKSKYSIS